MMVMRHQWQQNGDADADDNKHDNADDEDDASCGGSRLGRGKG